MSNDSEITRRLIQGAYEMGWRNACDDFIAQEKDATHPIGRGKRGNVDDVIDALDPNNLIGLVPPERLR